MEIQNLKHIKALRTYAKEGELSEAAKELMEEAGRQEITPSTMVFEQTTDYEETSEYQVVLWGA